MPDPCFDWMRILVGQECSIRHLESAFKSQHINYYITCSIWLTYGQ
jgi:hypothetical protein